MRWGLFLHEWKISRLEALRVSLWTDAFKTYASQRAFGCDQMNGQRKPVRQET
jgi:hypothetical protein